MPKYLIPSLLVVVVLGAGLFIYMGSSLNNQGSLNNDYQIQPAPVPPRPTTTPTPAPVQAPKPMPVKTIQMFDDKYVPSDMTINQNDIITFVNSGQNNHWPASNIHPTHQIYPEFDPRRPIAPGDSWSFRFEKAGVWRWHDHLYPTLHGTITVQAR